MSNRVVARRNAAVRRGKISTLPLREQYKRALELRDLLDEGIKSLEELMEKEDEREANGRTQ